MVTLACAAVLGAAPENVEMPWHGPKVTLGNVEFGGKVGAWDAADESLTSFAPLLVALARLDLLVEEHGDDE